VQAAKAEALRKKTGGLFVAQSSKAPKVRVCAVACTVTESCAACVLLAPVHNPCSIGMSHMAEYTCCSSVAFERPSDFTLTFTPPPPCAFKICR
jgi:hypothetical protein